MRAPTWTSIGCGPSTMIVRCRFRVRAGDGFVACMMIAPSAPWSPASLFSTGDCSNARRTVSRGKTRALALQRGELLRGARPVGGEAGRAALGELAPADRIGRGPAERGRGVDAIDLGDAEAEDFGLELRRQRRIAVALAQAIVDGEAAEGLELVLRRAVPDRIGAPEHTVLADMAQQLAQRMRRRGRVAHEEAPRAAELGIDIAVGREALVDADGADAEGPRLLDEGEADPRVVEIPALAARAPLRIDLPRGDRPLARHPRHGVQRLGLGRVGNDHAVQQQAIAAFERADELSRALRLLERERVVLGQRRHEAQHRHVRIAVDEDLLDETLGREAGDRVRLAASAPREARQRLLPDSGVAPLPPGADRVHQMRLYIEDELAAGERLAGRRRLECRFLGQDEATTGIAARGESGVEGEQGGRRAAQPSKEAAPRHAGAARMLGDARGGKALGGANAGIDGYRVELAVRSRVDLDRQCSDALGHRGTYGAGAPG